MFASNRCSGSRGNLCATHASRQTEKYESPCSPMNPLILVMSGSEFTIASRVKKAVAEARRTRTS